MALDVIIYLRLEYKPQVQREADVAQVVAHLIGSEEVTGPSPVISFLKSLGFQGFFHFLTNESRPFLSGFF